MKYIKTFESGIVKKGYIFSSDRKRRKLLRLIQNDIEYIFIDMIDDGINFDINLEDYDKGYSGHIVINNDGNYDSTKTHMKYINITEYIDIFHMFYDYITEKNYYIRSIRINKGSSIDLYNKDWEFIIDNLIKDKKINELFIFLTPIDEIDKK